MVGIFVFFLLLIILIWFQCSIIDAKKQEIRRLNYLVESYKNQSNEEMANERKILDEEARKLQNVRTDIMSQLSILPFMAHIIADFDTRGLDILADQLNWGHDQKRLKKVKSIMEIKREAKELIAHYKEAEYQLAYAIEMFPALEDFLASDYVPFPTSDLQLLSSESHDNVRNYLSPDEYRSLSTADRNQLALDRYHESRRKSNWQIGRDYEMYVGYKYTMKGYIVDYYGSYKGLEDLGRDLIATKGDLTLIIQCKYWSAKKQIHEKHITQLYGTMICYCYENDIPRDMVRGVLVTNINVSDTAKQFAHYLGIELVESFALGNYPCIKCNINHSPDGGITKIYHLPFDQQYDSCKINNPGEFFAMTVSEAENAGFRRAYRWHSS